MRSALLLVLLATFTIVNSKHIVLSEKELESDDIVFANVGDSIEVRLRGNLTTGFAWTYAGENSNASHLLLREKSYKVDEHPEGMVGVGGSQTFVFELLEEKAFKLVFHFGRGDEQMFSVVARISVSKGNEEEKEEKEKKNLRFFN